MNINQREINTSDKLELFDMAVICTTHEPFLVNPNFILMNIISLFR